jgi:glyoxylase-like metal-dependent hydrolase (beta-lactamase superfamily II)
VNIIGKTFPARAWALLAAATLPAGAGPTTPYSSINAAAAADPVNLQELRGGVAMLSGSGGNIGVLAGPDGLFMVDAGIAVSRPKVEAALRSVGNGHVRYVVNTHWHWDHTDGNAWLRRSGATIIADRNARRRLTQTIRVVEWEHTFAPIRGRDLPNDVLYGNKVMRFGREIIVIRPYRPGHTDGDLSVYFQKADVLQTGDTFWNGIYPFIDYAGGGDIDGAIRAANINLAAAGPNTLVIPGHGPSGNRTQLVDFRDMLVAVRNRVAALKARGRSADEVVASRPSAEFDAQWGRSVISGELFTRLVYQGV